MKKWVVIGVLLVFILFISLVNAESNETETTNETEVEECATSISISFNQDVYYAGDLVEITTEVFDSQGNHIPNYVFYVTIYDTMWHTPFSQETGADGYFRQTGTAIVESASGVGKSKYKVYTQESGSCGVVEDIAEIEIISEGEPESESTSSTEESTTTPTTCAAKIEVNFNKAVYAIGDLIKAEVGIFDSQGNPLSNYPFYGKRYDDRWHSPDFQRTGSDGYFRFSGEVEKGPVGATKGIFNVYTQEIGSCKSVEDTTEISLEESESVPCGIGTCIPEEEPEEPEEIPEDKIFYKCNGCELEDNCYPMGYRKEGRYCSENNEFIDQSKEGVCDNNFECKSNFCISDECVEKGVMKKIIEWFKKLFGSELKSPELEQCSELLIEKDIGGYDYSESAYGHKDHQVALYSEDGEQMDIVKCCVAGYENPDGTGGAGVVCPFDNKKDVENTVYWLSNKGEIILGEYNGQEVYVAGNAIIWTYNDFIVASGTDPNADVSLPEGIINAYLERYPNDLEI